jgi:dTDP-4-amino-4,6-dideoxygalactose transaminase
MTSNDKRQPAVMVTRTSLPPLEEYVAMLRKVWDSHWVTNDGPFVQQLERQLQEFLAVPDLCYVSNGTVALQLAVKALGLSGEVITTPFSYVATSGVLLWEGCTPVFADIRPGDLTIDPRQVEAAITAKTTAILATHIYGFPCDVDALQDIANRHGLKIVYDAAHAFGCKLNGRPLISHGDASCLSFHATKVFHTVEGGAVVVNGGDAVARNVRLMRAFGQDGDRHLTIGINAKNSELHAAMGLCNLPRLERTGRARRIQHQRYVKLLGGGAVEMPKSTATGFEYNYAYFPILMPDESALLRVQELLARINVYPRRYFYPALNKIAYVNGAPCPLAEDAALRVLCLPMSELVTEGLQEEIAAIIIKAAAGSQASR